VSTCLWYRPASETRRCGFPQSGIAESRNEIKKSTGKADSLIPAIFLKVPVTNAGRAAGL
jgi:hypothetical protein